MSVHPRLARYSNQNLYRLHMIPDFVTTADEIFIPQRDKRLHLREEALC